MKNNGQSHIVGIDLGTTNSGVGIWDEIENKVVVIKNIMNEPITPSIVAVQSGEIIVGAEAKNILMSMVVGDEAARTHKRDMGTPTRVGFNGEKVPPYILGSHVLKALKTQAEEFLGEEVDRAVITVPAFFAQSAVEDTKRAGEAAGFEVEALLPEPSAAALAFGRKVQEDSKIMVYDLGGGTFDISIIEAVEGQFVVRANGGNRYLGGDDFDLLLRDYVLNQSGYSWLLQSTDPRDRIALYGLTMSAEETKKRLSSMNSVPFRTRNQFTDSTNKSISIDVLLTRAIFEEIIRQKIDETIDHCNTTLKKANVAFSELKEILLVGGSTRIPIVASRLEKEYGIKPNRRIDPMTCVIEGAAIHTRSLKWMIRSSKLILEGPRKPPSTTKKDSITLMGKLVPKAGFEDEIDVANGTVTITRNGAALDKKTINQTGGFLANAELLHDSENIFALCVTDTSGSVIDNFSITVTHKSDAIEAPEVLPVDNIMPHPFSVGLTGETKIGVLLDEQSVLPASATKFYAIESDGQTELILPIYEGRDPHPERNRALSEIRISNLPPTLKRGDDVVVTFMMNRDRILNVQIKVPKASREQAETIQVGKISRDAESDDTQQKTKLAAMAITLKSIEAELADKLPLLPADRRSSIGSRDGVLRNEAHKALESKEIGMLEAKIEDLAALLREINGIIPDVSLTKEFRNDAINANNIVARPDIKSVDKSEIDEIIASGEIAIKQGDNSKLRAEHQRLKNSLNKMYNDIGSQMRPGDILYSYMKQYEIFRSQCDMLLRNPAAWPTKAKGVTIGGKGIIDKNEIQIGKSVPSQSHLQLESKIREAMAQGDALMLPARTALQTNDEAAILDFTNQFGFILQNLEGILTDAQAG